METVTTTQITEYRPIEAVLADLSKRYRGVIFDCTQPSGLKEARAAQREVAQYRIALEKKRKELKEDVLVRGRLIDGEAKKIADRLAELEDPIVDQIKAEERREAEAREAAIRAEQERLAAEERARKEAEEAKLAAERAEIARQRAAFEAEQRAAREKAEAEERARRAAEDEARRARLAEEERLAAARRAEEERLAAERRKVEEERAALERAKLEKELAEKRAAEEAAAKKRAEEEAVRRAEEERQRAEQRAKEEAERLERLEQQKRADAYALLQAFLDLASDREEFASVVADIREFLQDAEVPA